MSVEPIMNDGATPLSTPLSSRLSQRFSGSYLPDDVTFLLEQMNVEPIDVAEKERLLQSGKIHYSEVISRESPPTPEYMQFYFSALERHRKRMAGEVVQLAARIRVARPKDAIALISLARAGTPLGVLLRRELRRTGRECRHFSISIIRDRGIDYQALDDLRLEFDDSQLIFVDGWTGKGTIQQELTRTIERYNLSRNSQVPDDLAVLLDLSGDATFRATSSDYLLPCGMLNAIVSGLISRSILPKNQVPGKYHGCLFFEEYHASDQSREFVDEIDRLIVDSAANPSRPPAEKDANDERLFAARRAFIDELLARPTIDDWLKIKPGIGEATRALLRRVPETLIVRDPEAEDVQHLHGLAEEKNVAVEVISTMPYEAVTVIRSLGKRGSRNI